MTKKKREKEKKIRNLERNKDNENKRRWIRGSRKEKGECEGNVITLYKRIVTYVSISIGNCLFTCLCVILKAMYIYVFNLFVYLQTKYARGATRKKVNNYILTYMYWFQFVTSVLNSIHLLQPFLWFTKYASKIVQIYVHELWWFSRAKI